MVPMALVDDTLTGADSIDSAISIQRQLQELLAFLEFHLWWVPFGLSYVNGRKFIRSRVHMTILKLLVRMEHISVGRLVSARQPLPQDRDGMYRRF